MKTKSKMIWIPAVFAALAASMCCGNECCGGIENHITCEYVDADCLKGLENCKSLQLSSSVYGVHSESFNKCSMLERIEVDMSNDTLCSVDGVLYNKQTNSLIRVPCNYKTDCFVVPNSVVQVNDFAFSGCKSIEKVVFQGNSSNLDEWMRLKNVFVDCDELKEVVLNGSMYNIERTFVGCRNLSRVIIKGGTVAVKRHAFLRCANLRNICFTNVDIAFFPDAIVGCPNLESIDIEGDCAHYYSIDGVLCRKPDMLVFVPPKATLNGIYRIPDYIVEIAYHSFCQNINLTNIVLHAGVKKIRGQAFSNCSKLISINVDKGNAAYCSENGVLYDGRKRLLLKCPEAYDKELVVVPETVECITEESFLGCSNIHDVQLPSSLKSIGAKAFFASGIRRVTFPPSLKNLGLFAFSLCKELRIVDLGCYDGKMDNDTFFRCEKIESFRVSETNTQWMVLDGSLIDKINMTLVKYVNASPDKRKVTLPTGVRSIAGFAFFGNKDIEEIVLPTSVLLLGDAAFAQCPNLKSVRFLGRCPGVNTIHPENVFDENCVIHVNVSMPGWEGKTEFCGRPIIHD